MVECGDASDDAGSLSWQRSYDRASVEQFLMEAATRRDEARAELARARDRVERARAALERREATRNAELLTMVAEAHGQLRALDAEHDAAMDAARAAALAEVERLRAEAPAPVGPEAGT